MKQEDFMKMLGLSWSFLESPMNHDDVTAVNLESLSSLLCRQHTYFMHAYMIMLSPPARARAKALGNLGRTGSGPRFNRQNFR